MFTGIIEARGRIAAIHRKGGGWRLEIATGDLDLSDVALGDSIAVDGVCLTVVELGGGRVAMDVSAETLSKTTLGGFESGREVNLEKALTPTTRLGGHLVSGHVDGVGEVVAREARGESIVLRIEAPAELARYIARKGSICVDGVSLTVNAVEGARFDLNIIPHTAAVTTLESYAPGRRVNLEVDLIARYLERLLLGERAAEPRAPAIDIAFLAEHGFLGKR